MSHHTSENLCPNCEEKLTQAHPDLATWFRGIKASYPDCHIAWSFRDEADQEKAFQEGETKKHWPNSMHNYVHKDGTPCSLALDLFQLNEDNQAIFNPMFCARLNAQNEAQRANIRWGGTFQDIKDYDHFEIVLKDPEAPSVA